MSKLLLDTDWDVKKVELSSHLDQLRCPLAQGAGRLAKHLLNHSLQVISNSK